MRNKKINIKEIILITLACLAVAVGSYAFFTHKDIKFAAVDPANRTEGKEVEDYFVDKLRMNSQEAKKFADEGVSFYITGTTNLDAIISNLHYYGLVKDERAFREALEKTKDTLPGNENAIKVGNNTIDIHAYYGLKKGLTAWQVADVLLNHPVYLRGEEYNYMFMPGEYYYDAVQKTPAR